MKTERFDPEADGKGKVSCPADNKVLPLLKIKPNGGTMAEAFRKAGYSHLTGSCKK